MNKEKKPKEEKKISSSASKKEGLVNRKSLNKDTIENKPKNELSSEISKDVKKELEGSNSISSTIKKEAKADKKKSASKKVLKDSDGNTEDKKSSRNTKEDAKEGLHVEKSESESQLKAKDKKAEEAEGVDSNNKKEAELNPTEISQDEISNFYSKFSSDTDFSNIGDDEDVILEYIIKYLYKVSAQGNTDYPSSSSGNLLDFAKKIAENKNQAGERDTLKMAAKESAVLKLPVLALKDTVCFPNSVIPLFIGRENSLNAINESMMHNRGAIVLTIENNLSIDEIEASNLSKYCSIGRILQKIKLPNGTTKVLIDIECRGFVRYFYDKNNFISSDVELRSDIEGGGIVCKVLSRSILEELKKYIDLKKISNGLATDISSAVDNPSLMSDLVASFLQIDLNKKKELLQINNLEKRLERLLSIIYEENEILSLENDIQVKVKKQIDKNQREYYLNEQMKVIRKELGDMGSPMEMAEKYEEMIKEKNFTPETEAKIRDEIKKMKHSTVMSIDSIKAYLDTVFSLPWGNITHSQVSLFKAARVIAKSHYGLGKVKATILEYIASQIDRKKQTGAILCLYGPPGVGKTTLVKSIAEAMGRKYAKISLGGVKDESEIRGHRKTYIAAMPGRIIQTIKKIGVDNPVILLDEIDKIAHDYRGDPESALLEVLDNEQNHSFQDNYLEVEYDLSKVIFVATANSLNMQRPLLDRLEVVNVPSYLDSEKMSICQQYIIPKYLSDYNIKKDFLTINESAVRLIISSYTRESGVRELSRLIHKIVKKALIRFIIERESSGKEGFKEANQALESLISIDTDKENRLDADPDQQQLIPVEELDVSDDKLNDKSSVKDFLDNSEGLGISDLANILKLNTEDGKICISSEDIGMLLGSPKYIDHKIEKDNTVGIVNGLAYTEVGGEVLTIEAIKVGSGKGEIKLTGKLGEVMKESMQASFSYVKSKMLDFGVDMDSMKNFDIHMHVPAGAVPKDGPSAGITFCTALVSLMTLIPVRSNVAMTGEISLRGKILPIGGLREKITAAKRMGIKKVIIPVDNVKDLEDIPAFIKESLEIAPCTTLEESLEISLAESLKDYKSRLQIGDSTRLGNIDNSVEKDKMQIDFDIAHKIGSFK